MVESRREAKKRKSRQKILKASRRLFKEKGYDNTMIEDVADKAEVSKATLYNYFPNKESLLVGTMDDVSESFRKNVAEMAADLDIDEKIRRALTYLIIDSVPFLDVSRRILFLNATPSSAMFGKGNAVKDVFRILAEQEKDEKIFSPDVTTEMIVDQLMGVYLISQFLWDDLESMSEQDIRKKVDEAIDFALAKCYLK